jgi:hypothetical protein
MLSGRGMYVNGGLGSQAGCDIQLPKATAEPSKKVLQFCRGTQHGGRGELRWS